MSSTPPLIINTTIIIIIIDIIIAIIIITIIIIVVAQVTAEAIDRCFYLCWNREKLQYYLEANPDLKAAFDYMRGHDIMEKVVGFSASQATALV